MKGRRFKDKRLFVLNDPRAPRLCPALAMEIGLNESILFLQMEFWTAVGGEERAGKTWIRKSVREIHSEFPFWSPATVERIIQCLVRRGLIIAENFNENPRDKSRWLALNLEAAG